MKFWNLLAVVSLVSGTAFAQVNDGSALPPATGAGGGGGVEASGAFVNNCMLVADGTDAIDCAEVTYDDGYYDFGAGPPGYNWVALFSGNPDYDQDPSAGTFYLEGAYNGSELSLTSGFAAERQFRIDVGGAGTTIATSGGGLTFAMNGGDVAFTHDDIGTFLSIEDDELLTFPRGWKIDEPTPSTFFDIALAGTGTRNGVSVLSNIASWPEAGYLLVNNIEVMQYTKQNVFGVNITGRGKFGTTAVAHANGVSVLPILRYVALNDTAAPTEMIAGGGRSGFNAVPGAASTTVFGAVTTSALSATTAAFSGAVTLPASGSTSAATLQFASDPNTGIAYNSADSYDLVAGATSFARMSAANGNFQTITVLPFVDNGHDLGSAGSSWRTLYWDTALTGGTSSSASVGSGGISSTGAVAANDGITTTGGQVSDCIVASGTTTGTVTLDFAPTVCATLTIAATGNIDLLGTNYGTGRHAKVRIAAGASGRTISYDADWIVLGAAADTSLASGKVLKCTFDDDTGDASGSGVTFACAEQP